MGPSAKTAPGGAVSGAGPWPWGCGSRRGTPGPGAVRGGLVWVRRLTSIRTLRFFGTWQKMRVSSKRSLASCWRLDHCVERYVGASLDQLDHCGSGETTLEPRRERLDVAPIYGKRANPTIPPPFYAQSSPRAHHSVRTDPCQVPSFTTGSFPPQCRERGLHALVSKRAPVCKG